MWQCSPAYSQLLKGPKKRVLLNEKSSKWKSNSTAVPQGSVLGPLLQKKVVRAITVNNFAAPSTPIFSELKILKLYDLFYLKLLSFVYECINKTSPSYFHDYFTLLSSVHQYDTRQARMGGIFLNRRNTLQYGIRSVRYTGAKSWNELPIIIKQCPSKLRFRQQLKVHLFSTKY